MARAKHGRQQNVGTIERWVRVLGGGAAAIAGLALLLAGPASLLLGVAAVALVLLGLDFVVTGITGHCPLYKRLGWNTRRAHPAASGR
jgi:hypothetical protein